MGNSNMAARRGAKANRRKAIVAQKRNAGASGETLGAQVARAATTPILRCLLAENLFESGIGYLVLVRGVAIGQPAIAVFLLDPFCLGVRDVLFRTVDGPQLAPVLDHLNGAAPLVPVDPGYARKLLRDLVQWAGALGIQPHQDFAVVERLFGDIDPQACHMAFEFGQAGKPLYVAGPMEPAMLVRQRINQLSRRLGEGGFEYVVPVPKYGW